MYEQINSHYTRRPVIVILSHVRRRCTPHISGSTGSWLKQEWDPLYTGLSLGNALNVTLIANEAGLQAAHRRMLEVLTATPPGHAIASGHCFWG